MTEPRTEAGRTLLMAFRTEPADPNFAARLSAESIVRHAIPNIEREAADAARTETEWLREALASEHYERIIMHGPSFQHNHNGYTPKGCGVCASISECSVCTILGRPADLDSHFKYPNLGYAEIKEGLDPHYGANQPLITGGDDD